jgi:hypothetical protein
MQVLKGYLIVDELNKIVIGYIENGRKIKYISYENTESFAINVIPNKENLIRKLTALNNMSKKMGDGHTFSYIEIY